VQTLYKSHVDPIVRVIQGAPTSWDLSIANIRFPTTINAAVWSPCSQFIGIALYNSYYVVVLDAVTLEQLYTMHTTGNVHDPRSLIFSPDSSLLTGYFHYYDHIVSWDLQTGGIISSINTNKEFTSMTYSRCGTILGGLSAQGAIDIYNVLSGVCTSSHSVQQSVVQPIWTCGEYLQFATVGLGSITLQQVSFTSSQGPIKIESIPIPDKFSLDTLVLLSAISKLAFILEGRVVVQNSQHHKVLLDSIDVKNPTDISFSPDGCFFICGTGGPEFYLWKESPDCYLPHQKLVSSTPRTIPVISPNGESLISFGGSTLQLWYTKSPTPFSSASTETSQHSGEFIVGFSPDKSLVAITEQLSKTVTVLNLKSGNPKLVIAVDTEIFCIRITEDKVIIVGNGKIGTWDLPSGGCALTAKKNIDDSIQTTPFKPPLPNKQLYASISPNLNYVAITEHRRGRNMSIHNIHTGERLAVAKLTWQLPGFTSGGEEVWCASNGGDVQWWAIIKGGESDAIRLEQKPGKPPGDLFWQSTCGYQTTDDGWILNSSGKHLLWLPHHWRPGEVLSKHWSGNFLAIWNNELQEPIIFELEV
jgi:hypothetical protein